LFRELFSKDTFEAKKEALYKDNFSPKLALLEKVLGGKKFYGGDTPLLVDFHLAYGF
jgi:hypothetical protein